MTANKTMINNYQWDLFLSYHRGEKPNPSIDWINKVLLDLLISEYVKEIGEPLRIYHYIHDVPVGAKWPAELKYALDHSKMLFPLWTSAYFSMSKWCLYEFGVIRARERLLGFRSDKNPMGLIAPVKVSKNFICPSYANDIEYKDLSGYNYDGGGIKNTHLGRSLQREIRNWSPQLKTLLDHVPSWKADWISLKPLRYKPYKPSLFANPVIG